MNRYKFIIHVVISLFLLNGCDQILEPVTFSGNLGLSAPEKQEEFSINIKPLTFSSANNANKDPYPRKIMRTGSGSRANVFNEADFLNIKIPDPSQNLKYSIGIGDEISFVQLSEFLSINPVWPQQLSPSEYLLGVGDELTFVQQNDVKSTALNLGVNNEQLFPTSSTAESTVVVTEGKIGSDGNILLLGLSNINAINRSLKSVRTEVRNILIRNGLAPNFQLEITEFNSKKAFITKRETNLPTTQIIPISNILLTLHQVVLSSGISQAEGNQAAITLTRKSKKFRFTVEQLLKKSAPTIYIQDNDQIEIDIVQSTKISNNSIVGSQGNILIPSVGSIKAVNRTLSELQLEVSKKLLKKGFKPNFQLEINSFNSKKAYIIQKNIGTKIISLSNKSVTLREILLESNSLNSLSSELSVLTLVRNGKRFQMTSEQILDPKTSDIIVHDEDQIEIEGLEYKPGQVFALGGFDNAQIVSINPAKRETLADVLFVPEGPLSNSLVQRSEIYLIRNRKPSVAYHLDAQNVSRLLVAAQTELRPNDIIFVAERPIISFARTLSEINPLRILLRDIQDGNIP